MNITESFLTALDSLNANKLRSLLTMLGVIIGVAAVIALLGIGNGFSNFITQEINSIGTNLIFIATDSENSGGYAALSNEDVVALSDRSRVPAIVDVAGSVSGRQEVIYSGRSTFTSVTGVTANYFSLNNLTDLSGGDLFYDNDVSTQARVAVIGAGAAEDLFEDEFPIGRNVRINGISYEVIGVLASADSGFGDNDTTVYIPLTTAQARLYTQRTRSGLRAVSQITAMAVDENANDAALEQIATVLREQHDIAYAADDDFTLISQTDLLETFGTITGTLTLFLGAIAGISLLVGGIGIMNIMLVSVTERTREIGIRKALGALQRDILGQFLIESLFLSLIGGLIGIGLGWTMSAIAANALDIASVIDIGTISLAVGFSMFVGLVFGIYPAWRAARLRPIEALRYE